MNENDFCRIVNWYPVLGEHSLLTGFLKLDDSEIQLLANGVGDGEQVRGVVERLKKIMRGRSLGNCFVSGDLCSPTDTERFAGKRGAVFSPESAWFYLASSQKIRQAARNGELKYLAVRPFVKIDRTREFRLFIYDGELKAASQYNLVRHFRRLEGIKNELWETLAGWFEEVKKQLPVKNVTMDVFLENDDRNVKILDLNCWGEPTDPLLLRSFDRDWSKVEGLKLMLPPTKISGDVAVSF
ncbi:MAG: hypothetical protein E7047_08005 [Lentisphaerae bacterium]|nr:hypothetical protein [Lentisphaerota bacterium]